MINIMLLIPTPTVSDLLPTATNRANFLEYRFRQIHVLELPAESTIALSHEDHMLWAQTDNFWSFSSD